MLYKYCQKRCLLSIWNNDTVTSVFLNSYLHLADAFIQSEYFMYSGYTFFQYVFPGNWTHNLLRC